MTILNIKSNGKGVGVYLMNMYEYEKFNQLNFKFLENFYQLTTYFI